MTRTIEADVCIVGSGVSAAMVAERIAGERDASIVVIEAGDETLPLNKRYPSRDRFLRYGESPWPHDHLDDQTAAGPLQSRSMQVGGLGMHWGGVTPRFSPEDFRVKSLYGVGNDWPITYDDLDPFYQEAEERMGVAGEQGPPEIDPRSKPFPMPAIPLTYNLAILKEWAAKAGIPMWSQPSAKNSVPYQGRSACCRNDTCFPICPVGAKWSPDFTWSALRKAGRVRLLTRTMVRRLVPDEKSDRIAYALAATQDRPSEPIHVRAKTFVVAGGYTWSSHLLLLSRSSRFPNGVANRAGLVGKYLSGHRNVGAYVSLPVQLFPGINEQHSLVTKKFMRPRKLDRYVRHDLRVWESSVGRSPRLRDDSGALLLGDALLDDWRRRTRGEGTARVRAYYDVIPARESELTLDDTARNRWGDPLPRLTFRDADESKALRGHTEDTIRALFAEMARVGDGKIVRTSVDDFQDHPAGGCRMGSDPSSSVVDAWGRAHDHENLWIAGAPTCVSGGCANATLTFAALSLRTASRIAADLPMRAAGASSRAGNA
ncbi:MAG TPA: GMC family oxidoreductase [Gemmatimonadaceae bacterium]|nr:GMC family oxidoreductase [Gemmatimonadaceae bacterium]